MNFVAIGVVYVIEDLWKRYSRTIDIITAPVVKKGERTFGDVYRG